MIGSSVVTGNFDKFIIHQFSYAKFKNCGFGHWTVSCPKKDEVMPVLVGDSFLVDSFLLRQGEAEPEEQLAILEQVNENWRRNK